MPDAPPKCCEDVDLDMRALLCVERDNGALIGLEHTTPSLAQTQDEYTQLVQGMRVRVPFDKLDRFSMLLDSDSSAQIPEFIQSQLAPTKTA